MPEPRGWMVCISFETRETAENVARAIETWFALATHLRPIFTGDDGLEVPGRVAHPYNKETDDAGTS